MPRILVTNDDGYSSPGIEALASALRALGDVTVVAPLTEASAVGHALTLRRPLRIEEFGNNVYAVDGTPTDCVNIAIDEIMTQAPDIVVSGINKGLNVGDDVTYSGTVAGAFEAALLGYPGIAVSLERPESNFVPAAALAAEITRRVLEQGLPYRTFLNINVPKGVFKGLRTTVQARRNHITKVDRRMDPRQRPYFWIEEAQDDWAPVDRSDRQAIKDGYASVTPLQPDLTDHKSIDLIERLTKDVVTEVR
ncbi:MAG: 5'/3'-nucleotidase SurE [Acidobacteria bacterium]|nr:5'/3'-nucleotidase SurE [Acidobacteriota bacterium]